MSLENVEAAVLAEARKEAEALLAAARARLAEKLAAAKRESDVRIEARRRRELARLEGESARELSRARTESRLAVLAEKNRLIEEVFRRALAALAALPREDFLRLARRWLAEVPADIPGQIAGGERGFLAGAVLEEVNSGRKGRLELADEPGPAGGGLLVRAGRFQYDFTWAGRLADRRLALTGTIAAELFGESK